MGRYVYAAACLPAPAALAATNIARWDGTNWSALGRGVTGGSGLVKTMATDGTNLYVGGSFTNASARHNIAVWDGTNWSAFHGDPGTNKQSLRFWWTFRHLPRAANFQQGGGVPRTTL